MKALTEFWQSSRLRWVFILAGLAGLYIRLGGSEIFRQQFSVLAWKLVLVTVAITIAHYFRRHVFPYIDLSEIVKQNDTRSGLFFVGTIIFYYAVISAICGGL